MTAEAMSVGDPQAGTWTRRARPVDLAVVALTLAMSALTIWIASAPIAHLFDFLILGFVWLPIGAVWALSLIVVRRPTLVLGALLLLVLVAFSVLFGVGAVGGAVTTGLLALVGLGGVLLVVRLVFGRAILLDRPHRVVWLVAPAIVLLTVALAASGVARLARFTLAEPALRAYATEVLQRPAVRHPEETGGATIWGLTIDWSAARGGCAHLVTTHVGLLGEYPAGLAYCPSGPPRQDEATGDYEPFQGPWYRWASGSEFPFD